MSSSRNIRPSIYLDYGIDAVDAEDAACEICERGMRFTAQWRFAVGAMLNIAFSLEDGRPRPIKVEGLVIECIRTTEKEYQTTLAFVDTPQELRASLDQVSSRLGFRPFGSEADSVSH